MKRRSKISPATFRATRTTVKPLANQRLFSNKVIPKDSVFVEGIECQVHVGETEEERRTWQPCLVDVEVSCDLRKAGVSDSLEDTVNYVVLYQIVEETAKTKVFNLLEAFCEKIAHRILAMQGVQHVRLCAKKTAPPIAAHATAFGIMISRP